MNSEFEVNEYLQREEEKGEGSQFSNLPVEVKVNIFSRVSVYSLLHSAILVCKDWKKLIDDEVAWRARFENDVKSWKVIGVSAKLFSLISPPRPLHVDESFSPLGVIGDEESEDDGRDWLKILVSYDEDERKERERELLSQSGVVYRDIQNDLPISICSEMNWKKWYILNFLENRKLLLPPLNSHFPPPDLSSSSSPSNNNNNNGDDDGGDGGGGDVNIDTNNNNGDGGDDEKRKIVYGSNNSNNSNSNSNNNAKKEKKKNEKSESSLSLTSTSPKQKKGIWESIRQKWKKQRKYKPKTRNNQSSQSSSSSYDSAVQRVAVFGRGLRNSARGVISGLMWSNHTPLTVTKLYRGDGPGGVGSGVGFQIHDVNINLSAFYGGEREISGNLEFFMRSAAIIFVIDAVSTQPNYQLAIDQFHLVFSDANKEVVPIAILVCDHSLSSETEDDELPDDPDEEILGVRRSLVEISTALHFPQLLMSRYPITLRSVESLSDVYYALSWVAEFLSHSPKQRNKLL